MICTQCDHDWNADELLDGGGCPICDTARPDAPHVGLFNLWWDAYHQALFEADVTGRRYRVWYEPNNRWWNIRQLVTRHRRA